MDDLNEKIVGALRSLIRVEVKRALAEYDLETVGRRMSKRDFEALVMNYEHQAALKIAELEKIKA